jgi:hypothetical protein
VTYLGLTLQHDCGTGAYRDPMLSVRLHTSGWYGPDASIQVNLVPRRSEDFTAARSGQDDEL